MKLIIDTEFYDYFGGQKGTYMALAPINSAYKEFKRIQSKDFDYGDTYQRTRCFLVYEDYSLAPQRPHARSKEAWLKIKESLEHKAKKVNASDFIPDCLVDGRELFANMSTPYFEINDKGEFISF